MRTIIYSLIAVLLFGIVATSFKHSSKVKSTILVQATHRNASSDMLNLSAGIISKRLKSFSSAKFNVAVISEKKQIKITLADNQNLPVLENLVTKKGALSFSEVYNRRQFTELNKDNEQLLALLKPGSADHSAVIIGCIATSELNKLNDELNKIELNQLCKFAWSQASQKAETCLYALKPASKERSFPAGTDIESIKYSLDKGSKNYTISIVFNKAAAAIWYEATKRCINSPIAIVLDNTVLSAPTVKSEISGGRCEITGDFTEAEAKSLVSLVNDGELPLDFRLVK